MAAIHQLIAGYTGGDAISNEAVVLRRIFRSWGYESDIFCEAKRILPQLRKDSRDTTGCASAFGIDDVALLHLSIGSVVNDVFATLKCRKVILYHNITPPHFFALLQKQIGHSLETGLKQAAALAGSAGVTLADSRFNAGELERMGYRDVKVLPLVLDKGLIHAQPDQRTLREYGKDKVNVLFVGRCVPNKKLEDLLLAFSCFQKTVEPECRFLHAGSWGGLERYYHLLLAITRDLGLRNAHFLGSVSPGGLSALYERADVFLCMSEHEGFCIPIIESMARNVPVMAYAAAAVPETLDNAGILFREKDFGMVAEMMGRVCNDKEFRNAVIRQQQLRVERYFDRNVESELKELLAPVLAR